MTEEETSHKLQFFYTANNMIGGFQMTHDEHGDEGSLQQSHHYVTPVVFEVGHARVSHVQRKRHQEELDGWANQPRPLPLHPRLDVELSKKKKQ